MSKTNKHTNNYKNTNGIIDQMMNSNTMKIIEENNNYMKKLEHSLKVAKKIAKTQNKKLMSIRKAVELSLSAKFQQNVLEQYLNKLNISEEELLEVFPQMQLFRDEVSILGHSLDDDEGKVGTDDEGGNEEEDEGSLHEKFKKRVWDGFNEEYNKNEVNSSEINPDEIIMNQFKEKVLEAVERVSNSKSGISEKISKENHANKIVKESNYPMVYVLTREQTRKWLKGHNIILPAISHNIMAGTCKFNWNRLYYDKTIQDKLRENNIIICDEEDVGKDLEIVLPKYENKIKNISDRHYNATLYSSYPSSGNSNSTFGLQSVSPVFYTYQNTNDIRKSNCYSCNNIPNSFVKTQSYGNTIFKSSNVA